MEPFKFLLAENAKQAIAATHDNSRYLAGGTGILDLMKLHVESPEELIDIQNLGQNSIEDRDETIWIGASVSNSDMAHHALIKKNFPVVSKALLSGASVQLRNLATLAGNLLQRTRCSYFRDVTWGCNKRKPGSGCSAMEGYNRMHAVLGTSSQCIAAHPSDLCVALAALEARVQVQGKETRWIPFSEFHRLPGLTPQIEHALQPEDLVLGVEIPKKNWFKNSTYVKVRDRASYAFALSSVAVALEENGGVIANARIALGGVGTIPWRSKEAEQLLLGKKLDSRNAIIAAKAAMVGAKAHKYNSFKIHLAEQTILRGLAELGRFS